ncbi:MAG: hypothetical protein ABI600_04240, partial [Luteolibacter sp.]
TPFNAELRNRRPAALFNKVLNNVFLDCALPCETSFFLATWGRDMVPDYEKKWQAVFASPDAAVRMRAYPEARDFMTEDHIRQPGIVFSGNVTLSSGQAPPNAGLRVDGGPPERVKADGNIALPASIEAIHNLQAVPDLPDHAKLTLEHWRSAR